MAVNYATPPWMSAQATAPWEQAYAAGARTGQQRAQLALAAQAQAQRQYQEQVEFAARQEAQQRAETRREQEMAIEAAYKEAVIGIREREIAERAQREAQVMQSQQAKINQAMQQAAAQMEMAQMVKSGVDPMKALMDVGPRMGMNPSSFARLMMPRADQVPVKLGEQIPLPSSAGARMGVRTGPRSMSIVKTGADDTWVRNQRLNEKRIQRNRLQRQLDGILLPSELSPPEVNAERKQLRDPLEKDISRLNKEIEGMLKTGETTTQPTSEKSVIKFGPGMTKEDMIKELEAYRAPERGGVGEEGGMLEGSGEVGVEPEAEAEEEADYFSDEELLSDEDIDMLLGFGEEE